MKKNLILPLIALAGFFASCDDNTDELGYSLTNPTDIMVIDHGTFSVNSETVRLDNIISRSSIGYLGKIKDPETGSYITCNFMGQFHIMEDYEFPALDGLVLSNGEIIADSCKLQVFYSSTYTGDSTVSMKCRFQEFAKPLSESETYNVDFKPTVENGFLRKDGLKKSTTYSLTDYSQPEPSRWSSAPHFDIYLNDEYTDKDGKKYNNYGTYIMRKYYEPGGSVNFKNSYNFIHNVCPGFYLEHTGGIGCMANISYTKLIVYIRFLENKSICNGQLVFGGTEEVLQKTNISQDQEIIDKMKDDESHTYLKTPAGLYTQITIPVDSVFKGHDSDTLNTANMFISRENNTQATSRYTLPIPQKVILLPTDSVENFFANQKVADNRSSYTTSYSSATNGYTFSNISSMMRMMKDAKTKYMATHQGTTDEQFETLFPNWNKAVIIPVTISSITDPYTKEETVTRVTHNMSITSTKLVGGKDNPDAIKINCIYSKFQK